MTSAPEQENPEAEYWNNEGGERWVRYIDRLEMLAGTFSPKLIEGVNAQAGERLLDVGCGGGATSAAYADAVGPSGRVVGVDVSEVILEVARRRYSSVKNLSFITADAATHCFTPPAFDVVASRFGVMFFPDPYAAFRNIQAALEPGGRLCVACWRKIDENPWLAEPAAAAFSVLPAPEKAPPGTPGPFSLSDPQRFRDILGNANFVNIEFSKVDATLNLGNVEEALEIVCNLGPAAAAMREASSEARDETIKVLRGVLQKHETAQGVIMNAATWLVKAQTVA
ncbi:MAG: class I SAM-dependent methyltransferase [Gammaproteobacteria bacterium]